MYLNKNTRQELIQHLNNIQNDIGAVASGEAEPKELIIPLAAIDDIRELLGIESFC